jgi:hypothetical protein
MVGKLGAKKLRDKPPAEPEVLDEEHFPHAPGGQAFNGTV